MLNDILKGILGLRKEATDSDIINEVTKVVTDLRGKMGYVSLNVVDKMKRDGILKFDHDTQSFTCRISKDWFETYLNK